MQILMLLLVFAGLVTPSTVPQTPSASRPAEVVPPKLTLAFTIHVQVGPPTELGQVARGRRRIIPILGGTFEGPNIRGKVVPGGADWQIVRADGLAELDTRYLLQTESGQLIYIQNAGQACAAGGDKETVGRRGRRAIAGLLQDHPDVRDVGAGITVADQVDLRGHGRAQPVRCGDSSLEGRLTVDEARGSGCACTAGPRCAAGGRKPVRADRVPRAL